MKLDQETKELFNNVRVKLGAPTRTIPIDDDQMYSLFKMCVEDYAEIVQNFLIESNWSNIHNKEISTTDFAFALSSRTMDYSKDYSYWFSKEVGLQQRGGWELKKDFIVIEGGKQSYIVPKGREINKVLYFNRNMTPVANVANFGGAGIGGAGGMGMGGSGIFQIGGLSSGSFFMGQAVDSHLLASDLAMKTKMLSGDMSFKVTALASGEKLIHLMSTPGSKLVFGGQSNLNGSYVWYTYYDVKPGQVDKCRRLNPDVLVTPEMMPLSKMTYDMLNEPTKVLIRKLLVAEVKKTVALIFGRFSGKAGIQMAEATIDYTILAEQAKEEHDTAITELRERLTRMMPEKQTEILKNIAQNIFDANKFKPAPAWVII